MSKRSDIEIVEASIDESEMTKILVVKTNYILKPTIFDLSNISTIYNYYFETYDDYSELINSYNNNVENKKLICKKIIKLAIKNGEKTLLMM